VVGCLGGSACNRSPSSPAGHPDEGLPGRPPGLTLSSGDQRLEAVLGGFSWPVADGSDGLENGEEAWPPNFTTYKLGVAPGETVDLELSPIPTASPGGARALPVPTGARLELYPLALTAPSWRRDELVQAAATWDARGFSQTPDGTLRFRWRVDLPSGTLEQEGYLAMLTVDWPEPEGCSVTYNVSVVINGAAPEVMAAAKRFWQAALDADRKTLEGLVTDRVPLSPDTPRKEGSAGDPVPAHEATWAVRPVVTAAPQFTAVGFGPPPDSRRAHVRLVYDVELPAGDGEACHYRVEEHLSLQKKDDTWLVGTVSRGAMELHPIADGVEARRPVEAVEVYPGVTRFGPLDIPDWLPWTMSRIATWSPQGDVLAVLAGNGTFSECRLLDGGGDGAQRLLRIPEVGPEHDWRLMVWMGGWSRDGDEVYLASCGCQTVGPRERQEGIWVTAVERDGDAREVAWIPAGLAARVLAVERGGGGEDDFLLIRRSPDLWRVDLPSGRVEHLCAGLPSWDGTFRIRWSGDARLGGWTERRNDRVSLLNPETGAIVHVTPPRDVPTGLWLEGFVEAKEGPLACIRLYTTGVTVREESGREVMCCREIRLVDAEGRTVDCLVPPPGAVFSDLAFGPPGILLLVAGDVTSVDEGDGSLLHRSSGLYIWSSDDDRGLRLLAPLAGEEISSMSWSEVGQAVRLSLAPGTSGTSGAPSTPDTSGGPDASGFPGVPIAPGAAGAAARSEALLVTLDGEVRPAADDAGTTEWTVGERRVWLESMESNSRLRLQTPEGEETLASGPFRLWAATAASSDGSLALVTLSQQRLGGEGEICVWLIRPDR